MYGVSLVVLQGIGLVSALWFLATHRPLQWARLQALDAMGFPAIIALVFGRGFILTILSWPIPTNKPLGNMIVSVTTLALVDAWMIIKLASFRRFVAHERDRYREDDRSSSSDR